MKLVEAQEGRRIARPPRRLRGVAGAVARVGAAPARPDGCRASRSRLVVERERARMAFRSAEYWDLEGRFAARGTGVPRARSSSSTAERVADGRDFDPATGAARAPAPTSCTSTRPTPARSPAGSRDAALHGRVASSRSRSPSGPKPPFTTSTLQQEAGHKLRFSAGRTMSVAQGLYERGLHHLHADRLASNLSEQAVDAARAADRRAVRPGVPARRRPARTATR